MIAVKEQQKIDTKLPVIKTTIKKIESLTFLDLFAGVGGFRFGMEKAGHRCIGFCEIDKFARQSYKAIHNTTGEVEMHDITTVTDEFIRGIGPVDVLCGGFPCQAFSIAGKRRGFEDTRGTLFFEIARFAKLLKPKYLLLENVKGLLNHEKGATFETILRTLDELGMTVRGNCLTLKYTYRKIENGSILSDVLEEQIPEQFFLSSEKAAQLIVNQAK